MFSTLVQKIVCSSVFCLAAQDASCIVKISARIKEHSFESFLAAHSAKAGWSGLVFPWPGQPRVTRPPPAPCGPRIGLLQVHTPCVPGPSAQHYYFYLGIRAGPTSPRIRGLSAVGTPIPTGCGTTPSFGQPPSGPPTLSHFCALATLGPLTLSHFCANIIFDINNA